MKKCYRHTGATCRIPTEVQPTTRFFHLSDLVRIHCFAGVRICCTMIFAMTLAVAMLPTASYAKDFSDIKARGELRVLSWEGYTGFLPQNDNTLSAQHVAITTFAEQHNLKVRFISLAHYGDLIPALLAGQGDVIVANMTITLSRRKEISFTYPVSEGAEYLLEKKSSNPLSDAKSLNQRTLSVQPDTAFAETAKGLQRAYPGLKIKMLDAALNSDDILDKLSNGELDLVIEDSNTFDILKSYHNDIHRSLQASAIRQQAWAVAPDSKKLLKELNHFLREQKIGLDFQAAEPENQWQTIKANKTIRFVMRNNMASYFIWQGDLYGFNYELARKFAKQNDLRYQIIVAPDNEALLDYVLQDKADIALGFLTPTPEREAMGIGFSKPYHYASELVVTRSNDDSIDDIVDLNKRHFYVRRSSAYWHTLENLKQTNVKFSLSPVDETLETEDIIEAVASGEFDLTLADNHIVDLEMTWRDDIQSAMALGEPLAQSWAVKAENESLLKEVNHFIKKEYRGLFYNVTYNKYFKNKRRLQNIREDYSQLKQQGRLSPYDDLVKQYASQFDFDWRLLVSQMYQESRFDADAESWSGAQGLFQVMPRTAEELGITELNNPEQGIKAGITYLDWVRDRAKKMNPKDEENLLYFTLASYNAGAGHVWDAIRLARKKGYRDNVWFDNVERAMLLLSKKEYARQARYGYVRGQEPVDYVRLIKKRYDAYRHAMPTNIAAP